ncbi:hypothetical protein F5I97DRAFT_1923369 [Phlebopus sp. FC_14]|nr:hypothetical protein F5I97DRAFT_1923369 [Phlebopus sp. FC_14]
MDDVADTYYTICVAFAGFMVPVWDHCVTFDDESAYFIRSYSKKVITNLYQVNLIWNGRNGLMVYLFLLNRHLTQLGFIVNLLGEMRVKVQLLRCEPGFYTAQFGNRGGSTLF